MFKKQYRFTGTHADMVNALTAIFDDSAKAKLFEHNYDVYINAPLVGFLYQRKGIKNTNSEIADQNIFPEQMINNSDQLIYILRLILMLDSEYEADIEKRLDKAFRELGKDEADLALFDSYVLGGVEILYEKLIDGALGSNDYINKMYDFLEEFHERFNEEITNKDILEFCRLNTNSK
ncbi:hypothetical protein MKC71_10585 [[Clostridium] innocuum]|nr:hypothetical protein [[Clostridium] innocuum]MCR0560288.1 hypothetical protein [[Clostridium] innocuum]